MRSFRISSPFIIAGWPTAKLRHWTLLVMHKITNLWKLSSIGHRNCEIIMQEKTPLSHEVVCFQNLDFDTSNSKSEVSKSNSWKITSFSKTMSLQREPFLRMFFTINLSPLLVTKKGFMLIIILSNYQYNVCTIRKVNHVYWSMFLFIECCIIYAEIFTLNNFVIVIFIYIYIWQCRL